MFMLDDSYINGQGYDSEAFRGVLLTAFNKATKSSLVELNGKVEIEMFEAEVAYAEWQVMFLHTTAIA